MLKLLENYGLNIMAESEYEVEAGLVKMNKSNWKD